MATTHRGETQAIKDAYRTLWELQASGDTSDWALSDSAHQIQLGSLISAEFAGAQARVGPQTEDSARAAGVKTQGMFQQLESEYWWSHDVTGEVSGGEEERGRI